MTEKKRWNFNGWWLHTVQLPKTPIVKLFFLIMRYREIHFITIEEKAGFCKQTMTHWLQEKYAPKAVNLEAAANAIGLELVFRDRETGQILDFTNVPKMPMGVKARPNRKSSNEDEKIIAHRYKGRRYDDA